MRGTPGVGLDIEDNRIRMAVLARERSRLMVESFTEAALPAEAVENGRIKGAGILAEVLREAWSALGTRERSIAVALPNQQAFVRNLILPPMKARDVFKAAGYHFLSVIPLTREEAVVRVSGMRPTDTGELEVTIVAARQAQVGELAVAIEQAGLRPGVMEIRALAARRVLDIDERPQLLVDIGSQTGHLGFFERGGLKFVRTLLPGKAPDRDGGGIDAGELRGEIGRSLEYWGRESGRDLNLSRLTLIGEDAKGDWGAMAERGFPWPAVETPGRISPAERLHLERNFIVAMGLAARRRQRW